MAICLEKPPLAVATRFTPKPKGKANGKGKGKAKGKIDKDKSKGRGHGQKRTHDGNSVADSSDPALSSFARKLNHFLRRKLQRKSQTYQHWLLMYCRLQHTVTLTRLTDDVNRYVGVLVNFTLHVGKT